MPLDNMSQCEHSLGLKYQSCHPSYCVLVYTYWPKIFRLTNGSSIPLTVFYLLLLGLNINTFWIGFLTRSICLEDKRTEDGRISNARLQDKRLQDGKLQDEMSTDEMLQNERYSLLYEKKIIRRQVVQQDERLGDKKIVERKNVGRNIVWRKIVRRKVCRTNGCRTQQESLCHSWLCGLSDHRSCVFFGTVGRTKSALHFSCQHFQLAQEAEWSIICLNFHRDISFIDIVIPQE